VPHPHLIFVHHFHLASWSVCRSLAPSWSLAMTKRKSRENPQSAAQDQKIAKAFDAAVSTLNGAFIGAGAADWPPGAGKLLREFQQAIISIRAQLSRPSNGFGRVETFVERLSEVLNPVDQMLVCCILDRANLARSNVSWIQEAIA